MRSRICSDGRRVAGGPALKSGSTHRLSLINDLLFRVMQKKSRHFHGRQERVDERTRLGFFLHIGPGYKKCASLFRSFFFFPLSRDPDCALLSFTACVFVVVLPLLLVFVHGDAAGAQGHHHQEAADHGEGLERRG